MLDGQQLRVLVVDDVHDAADSLAVLVRLWGHDARAEYEAPSALEAARSYQPDVVLLDIGLPGADGYRLAEQLRKEVSGASIVAVTGYADPAHQERWRQAGFQEYLVKPPDLALLERMLRLCRERRTEARRLAEQVRALGAKTVRLVEEARRLLEDRRGRH